MEKTSPKSIIWVFVLFLTMFLTWLIVGSIGFYKAVASKNWPVVKGTVISSNVIRPSGKSTKYVAEITYSYIIGNKEYTSKKLKATAARGTSEWAKAKVEEYPANAFVSVHYNPQKPELGIIEPGLQSDNLWMTLAPLIAMLLISIAMRKQIKDRKNQVLQQTDTI